MPSIHTVTGVSAAAAVPAVLGVPYYQTSLAGVPSVLAIPGIMVLCRWFRFAQLAKGKKSSFKFNILFPFLHIIQSYKRSLYDKT
jgi:hypothetical protein